MVWYNYANSAIWLWLMSSSGRVKIRFDPYNKLKFIGGSKTIKQLNIKLNMNQQKMSLK
jgi:hypothetical protein